MSKRYKSLQKLLENNGEANMFFDRLPDYIQEQILTSPNNVYSIEALKDYAEYMVRGDGIRGDM